MAVKPSAEAEAKKFLAEAAQFQLGVLPTEARHPRTGKLSQMAADDVPGALRLIAEIDRDAVRAVERELPFIEAMGAAIRETLKDGGRIFFCGCGATGRLSVVLETLWREEAARRGRADLSEKVFSFIAGGDYAMVRAIENFEDHPEYGKRQLFDLGFRDGDLLVATTEGGETPFVIGATEAAAEASRRAPYFMYCNPEDVLKKTVERSRRVIENPKIRSRSLPTGPMVLSGSTRLQATTALQLAAGAALFTAFDEKSDAAGFVKTFADALAGADWAALAPVVVAEAEVYRQERFCVHRTSRYPITVLTDTTERTPTFSLLPFENPHDTPMIPAWTYLCVPQAASAAEAWGHVLGRGPRPVDWDGFRDRYGMTVTLAYDFSPHSLQRRREAVGPERLEVYDIEAEGGEIVFRIGGAEARLRRPQGLLAEHLLLKCAMNSSSTLVMGRLGRYRGNMMAFVRPTNKKLIDRSIRYIRAMLEEAGETASYEETCLALFETFRDLPPDQPVVVRTAERLLSRLRREEASPRPERPRA